MDPSMDEKARRVRNLLSSYYGGEDEGAPEDDTSAAAGSSSAASKLTGARASGIDSATFDSDRFIRSLLKGTRLDGLMSKHAEMSTEIKSLDGDMQMLVYENYNKFISATDTIRNMKSNVDGMDSNMQELMTTIDSVADRSSSVNSKLQQRRDHIEELNRVRTLLKKLQVVFDLPKKLQAALDNDALEVAVEQYSAAMPVLRRFGHQGAFRTAAAETAQTAKDVIAALRRRLLERKDEAAECIHLLEKMGEPVEALQEDYLECRTIRMEGVLSQASQVVRVLTAAAGLQQEPEDPSEAPPLDSVEAWGVTGDAEEEGEREEGCEGAPPPRPPPPPSLQRLVVELDSRFLGEVVLTVSSFGDLFPEGRRRLLEVLKGLFLKYFALVRLAVSAASTLLANGAAGLSDEAPCGGSGASPGALGADWGGAMVAAALRTVSTDLGRMAGLLPELGLQDRTAEVVEAAIRHQVGACFRALELRIVGEVRLAYANIEHSASGAVASQEEKLAAGQALLRAQKRLVEVLEEAPGAVLAGMRSLLDEGARLLDSWRDMFVDLVAGSLQNLLLALLAHFRGLAGLVCEGASGQDGLAAINMRYGNFGSNLLYPSNSLNSLSGALGTPGKGNNNPNNASVASAASVPLFSPLNVSLNFSFGDTGLPAYISTPDEPAPPPVVLLLACVATFMEGTLLQLCMEQLAGKFPGGGGGGGGEQPPAFVAGELARRISAAAAALLSAYVEAHGRKISLMVRRSIEATDWLRCKEPRSPRAVCVLMLERLAVAEGEVVQLLGDGGGHNPGSRADATEGTQDFLSRTSSMERNVAKLFTEKVKIFGDVEFKQPSVLVAISRVGLKSWVECVRLQTLARAGLQQLQLDVHFLRPQLRRFGTAGGGSVDSLLDEVLGAAVERATDPTLLELGLLDRILTSYAKSRE